MFICENNDLAIHSKVKDRSLQKNHYKFAEVFKIQNKFYKDNDIVKLCKSLKKDISSVKNKQKPLFIEIKTNRWLEHVGPNEDWYMGYRNKKISNSFLNDDPLTKLSRQINKTKKRQISNTVEREIRLALNYAKKSKFPKKEEVFKHVFKK